MKFSRRDALVAAGAASMLAASPLRAAAAPTPAEGYMGLGWYIRRTGNATRLAEWYGGVFRMPLIRGMAATWFFWGGDTLSYELKSEKVPFPQRWTNPKTAPTIGMFRSTDMAASLARLRSAGARIVGEERGNGVHDLFVLDPDNQLIGVRQAKDDRSALGQFNPGVSPMPADLSIWDWTIRRVPDVAAEVAFYRDVCGFPMVGGSGDRTQFQIGGVTGWHILEIAPGGTPLPVYTSREDSLDALICRVASHDAMNARLKRGRARIVDDAIQFNSARLTYCASPSGQLIGFEERYDPDRYAKPRDDFLEDREANRRWRDRRR